MEKTITFECWTYNDDPQRLFMVDISSTQTVAALREVIRQEKSATFRDVDLDLYSIRLPDGEEFEEELTQWTLKDKACLNARSKVSLLEGYTIIAVPIKPNMTIHFWVRGQATHTIHCVEVPIIGTVASLRTAVKSKAQIDIPYTSISLYKVALPWASLEDALRGCTIASLGMPLEDPDSLSSVFTPQPPNDELHVIVEGSMPFFCLFRGQKIVVSLQVYVSMEDVVEHLRNAISAAYKDDDLSLTFARLYKIQLGDDNGDFDESELVEIVNTFGGGQLLKWGESLSRAFSDVAIASRLLYIVVEADEKAHPSRSIDDLSDDPIRQAREEFLRNAETESPSTTAIPAVFQDRQQDRYNRKSIPCGRPREYEDIIPTVLLHPAFGHFVDDCSTIEATAEDYTFVWELANAVLDFYDGEIERAEAIAQVFATYGIDIAASRIGPTGYMTNGDLRVQGHCCIIIGAGTHGGEPYFQALGCYLESTRDSALEFVRSPLPCFVLATSGPTITFAGAAWNLRPTAQLLTTLGALHFHPTDFKSRDAWARHLAALRRATQSLKDYYNKFAIPPPTSGLAPPHLFPHPTSYISLQDGTLTHFRYVEGIPPRKLIFHGIADTNNPVYIKFVQTYSRDAHIFLASLGCAPILRGFEKIPGGWFMVVMDWLAPTDFETLDLCKRKLPSSTFDNISTQLKSFHDAGFVHGDIRDANIMVSKPDGTRIMITDFDWAGNVGEARYPFNMDYTSIQRPSGARNLDKILVEHDDEMLSCLKSAYFV